MKESSTETRSRDPFEDFVIKARLDKDLGKAAKYWEFQPVDTNITGKILGNIQQMQGVDLRLFIAEDAPAEPFALTGSELTSVPIVLSTSFLGLYAEMRRLFRNNDYSDEVLRLMAVRLGCRVIAEFSVVYPQADPDIGALALAWSDSIFPALATAWAESNTGGQLPNIESDWEHHWRELEVAELNESTMMMWYSALTHEIGHVVCQQGKQPKIVRDITPDLLREVVDAELRDLDHYPARVKAWIRSRFEDPASKSCVNAKVLLEEIHADYFGVFAMMECTSSALGYFKQREILPPAFISEFLIFINCLMTIQQLQAAAILASQSEPTDDEIIENTTASFFAHSVRSRFIYMQLSLPSWYLSKLDQNTVTDGMEADFMDEAARLGHQSRKRADLLEEGFAKAAAFVQRHHQRPSEIEILAQFQGVHGLSSMAPSSVPHFVSTARSFDRVTPFVAELDRIYRAPTLPPTIPADSQMPYIVFFIEGKNGPMLPRHTLSTGNVCFAFHPGSSREQSYHSVGQEHLGSECVLKRATVFVHRHERLPVTISEQFDTSDLEIVAEGTRRFKEVLDEMAEEIKRQWC